MIAGPAGRRWLDIIEAQFGEIERVDERIDRANRIALVDPVIEAFRQQRRLAAIGPFDEPLHRSPPRIAEENHSRLVLFTQPGSFASCADFLLSGCSFRHADCSR